MWASLKRHWFLFGLGFCFATGFWASGPLTPLLEMTLLRSGLVFAVMWTTGITLPAAAIRHSLGSPGAAALAIGINAVGVPLLSLPASWLLPQPLFGGLFVAALVPCTLASAAVWTRKAGGDDSIALMTTVVTNLACVLVVPVGLILVLGREGGISAGAQVMKLASVVVVPLVLAQAMRRAGAAAWADRHKRTLSIAAQLGILVMVFLGAIASGGTLAPNAQTAAGGSGFLAIAVLVVAIVVIHLTALWLGVATSRRLGWTPATQIAVGFSGSQKTLMVGLQIAIDAGVSVVPMIVYHLGQLVLDTLIAQRWQAAISTRPPTRQLSPEEQTHREAAAAPEAGAAMPAEPSAGPRTP